MTKKEAFTSSILFFVALLLILSLANSVIAIPAQASFTVSAAKDKYSIGEEVIITATSQTDCNVTFEVDNTADSPLLIITKQTENNKAEISFIIPNNTKTGKYTVYAVSALGENSTTTFVVQGKTETKGGFIPAIDAPVVAVVSIGTAVVMASFRCRRNNK